MGKKGDIRKINCRKNNCFELKNKMLCGSEILKKNLIYNTM